MPSFLYAKKILIARFDAQSVYMRFQGRDLFQEFLRRDMRPAAAGEGSLSLRVMRPRSRARGRPRTGTAFSSFPRKPATPLFGAIAKPTPALTKPSIVANCDTVTT